MKWRVISESYDFGDLGKVGVNITLRNHIIITLRLVTHTPIKRRFVVNKCGAYSSVALIRISAFN
jgi:hypothetical protein